MFGGVKDHAILKSITIPSLSILCELMISYYWYYTIKHRNKTDEYIFIVMILKYKTQSAFDKNAFFREMFWYIHG